MNFQVLAVSPTNIGDTRISDSLADSGRYTTSMVSLLFLAAVVRPRFFLRMSLRLRSEVGLRIVKAAMRWGVSTIHTGSQMTRRVQKDRRRREFFTTVEHILNLGESFFDGGVSPTSIPDMSRKLRQIKSRANSVHQHALRFGVACAECGNDAAEELLNPIEKVLGFVQAEEISLGSYFSTLVGGNIIDALATSGGAGLAR